jgi:Bacterial pre-peptidase C-terminal domain
MFEQNSNQTTSTRLTTALSNPGSGAPLSTSAGTDPTRLNVSPGTSLTASSANLAAFSTGTVNIGSLQGRQAYSSTITGSGNWTTYQFTIDTTANLSLSLTGSGGDADLYLFRNGQTAPIQFSRGAGNQEFISVTGLAAGTYYADVFQDGIGSTNYNLTLTSDTAGNTLSTARNLGSLNGTTTIRDFVGADDLQDFYRVQLNGISNNLAITLSNLTADADLSLIRDINNNGLVDSGERIAFSGNLGTATDSINLQNLAAGNYFIGVSPYSGNTNYALSVTATNATPPVSSIAIPNTVINLGNLQGQVTLSDTVNSSTNVTDFIRFNLTNPGNLNLSLTGVGGDADLWLVRDVNADSRIDSSEIINYSVSTSNLESINAQGLAAGTYYAIVYQANTFSSTNYTLTLTSDSGDNTLKDARNLGILNGAITVQDFVGTIDPRDTYQFQVTGTNNTVAISLQGLTADADVYVTRDANNNGVIDLGETIGYSYNAGTTPENILLQGLAAGTYYIEVAQYRGNTNYTLGVSTLPLNQGNGFNNPIELGTVGTDNFVGGNLNSNDSGDFYRFSLGATSDLALSVSGLTNTVNGLLVRDNNSNGVIDAGDTVQRSFFTNGTVNLAGLAAGSYLVGLFRNGGDTNYTLGLTPDAAGNTIGSARNVNLLGNRTFTDVISSADPTDFYRFTLNTTTTIDINLSGFGDDLDMDLIRDVNNNGSVNGEDVLQSSSRTGNQAEQITRTLAAGTYYIRVQQGRNTTNINSAYKLDFSEI